MFTPHVIAVDLVGLLFAVVGFTMAFRQRFVRGSFRRIHPRDPARPPRAPRAAGDDADPAHYALIIFGMMLGVFGTLLVIFTTAYAAFTTS